MEHDAPGFISKETARKTIIVLMRRLDQYLLEGKLERVDLIKIDTEGFELSVIKGLSEYPEWQRGGELTALVMEIEVAPRESKLLGTRVQELENLMGGCANAFYWQAEPERTIRLAEIAETQNAVCVPPGQRIVWT